MHSDSYATRINGQIGSAQPSVKLLASEHSMSVAVMETWEALNSGVAICAGPPAIAQCAHQRAQSCTRQGCGPSGLRRCDTPRILILKNRLDICGSTRRRSQCGVCPYCNGLRVDGWTDPAKSPALLSFDTAVRKWCPYLPGYALGNAGSRFGP